MVTWLFARNVDQSSFFNLTVTSGITQAAGLFGDKACRMESHWQGDYLHCARKICWFLENMYKKE